MIKIAHPLEPIAPNLGGGGGTHPKTKGFLFFWKFPPPGRLVPRWGGGGGGDTTNESLPFFVEISPRSDLTHRYYLECSRRIAQRLVTLAPPLSTDKNSFKVRSFPRGVCYLYHPCDIYGWHSSPQHIRHNSDRPSRKQNRSSKKSINSLVPRTKTKTKNKNSLVKKQ